MKYSTYSSGAGLITNEPTETSIVKGHHTATVRPLIAGTDSKTTASKG